MTSQAPHWHVCPNCGKAYRWIGWMNRRERSSRGGWHVTDTHIMACVGTTNPLDAPARTTERPGPHTESIHERG